jgi:diguanylate cyclase (GGDEF)-like protein
MYNTELADAILAQLGEAFPQRRQLMELKSALQSFAHLPDDEWHTAIDALMKEHFVDAKVVRAGLAQVAVAVANVEITPIGRHHLSKRLTDAGRNGNDAGDTDDLLPIFPKRRFDADLASLLTAAGVSAPLALVMFDIDDFKRVNDGHGHAAGNEVLIAVASTIKDATSGKGRCYRWGGDELALLLSNYTVRESAVLAERIRDSVGGLKFQSYPNAITLSIGISSFPEVSQKPVVLFEDADGALYRAKNEGRDRICMAEASGMPISSKRPARPSPNEIKTRAGKVRLWLKLIHGRADNFCFEAQNQSDEQVVVEEVSLKSDGYQLTENAFPETAGIWTIAARGSHPIAWRCQTDPAATLTRMHDNAGIHSQAELHVVLLSRVLGESLQVEQKLPVRVRVAERLIVSLL